MPQRLFGQCSYKKDIAIQFFCIPFVTTPRTEGLNAMSALIDTPTSDNLTALRTSAHALHPSQRQGMALNAIRKDIPISHIATQHDVSRKFVYQQKAIALEALAQAFESEKVEEEKILFHLPITKAWIHRFVLALILICHSSFRNVIEVLRDLFGFDISIGTVHNIVERAIEAAKRENAKENLSSIRVGAHDEIFQSRTPVLVGCDTRSTYCYLLSAVDSRDAETWGIALLEAGERGLNPDYTVADGGQGLRAGQSLAWPETPCHSDVFHALHDLGKASIFLENRAYGALAAKDEAERKMVKAKRRTKGNKFSRKLGSVRTGAEQAIALSDDTNTLLEWLQRDILSVAGPDLKTREDLFDFIMEELKAREEQAPHRIGPIRRKLENQKADLLRFAGVMDQALEGIAEEYGVDVYHVRSVLLLERPDLTQSQRLQLEEKARKVLNHRFYGIQKAVKELMSEVVRASSVIENLNSRLRNYFFLRKQIGASYLELLRFYLNHRRFMRSEHPDRVGKSPQELMTGLSHVHWLDLLGLPPCQLAA